MPAGSLVLTLEPGYGQGDRTLVATGGEAGVRALVDAFYDIMSSDPACATIRAWHANDLSDSRARLSRFLIVWMGGRVPDWRPVNIPAAHAHLDVTADERDQWLRCMSAAMVARGLPDDLQAYLRDHFAIPAERIRAVCQRRERP